MTPVREALEPQYQQFRRTAIAEMTPWVEGFDMSRVSVSAPDKEAGSPKPGDMIARNPKNHDDKWLVAAAYFADNFAAASAAPGEPCAVKPLEWRDHRPDSFPEPAWSAQTPFGFYNIEEVSASDSPAYVVRLHAHHFVADKDGLDEAKAAAQADYEQRIRSALVTTPQPAAGWDALRANLREAWSALALIRETVETLGHVGAMPAAENLDGPTFMHEAEAIVQGIQLIALRREAPAPAEGVKPSSIVTCCVTGAIPGDGGACGDCDPCIMGEASVPEPVKRLIAEKNSLLQRVGELEDAAAAGASAEARLREALDITRNALVVMRARLRTEPTVQGRGWVDLGIVVNDAIEEADKALSLSGGDEAKESEGGVPPFGGYGSAEAAVAAADGSAQTCHETFKALRKIIDVAYDALAMTWDRAGSPGPSDPTAEARLREALREKCELIDDVSPSEEVGVFDGSGRWIALWTVDDLRALSPPSGGDEAKESDGEGKVDLSSALFSKGRPRIHAHGVTPVGTIATNMDSIGARPSDPTAADRREIVARETNDEFRIIPGFEDYEISRDCRLRRVVPISTTSLMPRFLRARPTPEGYLKYTLRVNGKTRSVIAHRAVALAWLGLPPDDKPCVAHLDNVRSNNNADNLRWVSYKENEDHKKAHGTYRQGTACISSRLNDDIVLDARKRHAKGGVTIKDLAVEYQVRVTTMADAVLGRSWKHLPMFEVERHPALDGGRDA